MPKKAESCSSFVILPIPQVTSHSGTSPRLRQRFVYTKQQIAANVQLNMVAQYSQGCQPRVDVMQVYQMRCLQLFTCYYLSATWAVGPCLLFYQIPLIVYMINLKAIKPLLIYCTLYITRYRIHVCTFIVGADTVLVTC